MDGQPERPPVDRFRDLLADGVGSARPEREWELPGEQRDLTITVLDGKGDPVAGATVVLDGCNIARMDGTRPYGTTDSAGHIALINLQLTQTGKAVGFITVTVTKSGYGTDTSLSIPVISG